MAVGAVFSALAAVAVALRFYTRLRVNRAGLSVDDWLMAAAFFFTLGMGIMLIVGMIECLNIPYVLVFASCMLIRDWVF